MVVDLIGIYGLKGPYCTLTTTNWFLQALSVISRGSWGDVARRFTMIRWAKMLSDAHRVALEKLLKQQREHKLEWTRPSNSRLFEGANIDRGAVIARSNTIIISTCWIRHLLLVYGAWTVEEGSDKWVCVCKASTSCEQQQLSQRKFLDAFAPICIFVEPVQALSSQPPVIKTWVWARVCTDIIQFSLFGHLQPVGTHNLCTDIVPVGPVLDRGIVPRRILHLVQNRIQAESFGYFFVQNTDQSISSESSSENKISIRDARMHFTADDIPQIEETTAAIPYISIPAAVIPSIDYTELRTVLKTKIWNLSYRALEGSKNFRSGYQAIKMSLSDQSILEQFRSLQNNFRSEY
ncbi:hypothetical protein F511_32397 [Dorcoceras hygrometricum]|uniref:Uncharacterized protein n=1 Tax=Dorcoceras hygrometricum TaxID=472368 RepID=A0A2Z7AXI0_9LAMI|nr:hypothetical protein F511_32397 [Dorcoceras hygrometricum]